MNIKDIEEVFDLGKKLVSCSYYGTRKSLPMSEVVTMPYSMLVQESTRDSIGIDLKGNVVIIDEAHNLIEGTSNVGIVQQSSVGGRNWIREDVFFPHHT